MSDLIDRQKAIDAVCSVCGNDCDKSEFVYDAPQDKQVILCPEHYALTSLPSAQPEPKTGKWISCKKQLPPTTMICHCTIQREGYLGSDVKDRSMIDLVYDEPDHKWRRLSGIQLSADYRVVAWMQAAEVYGGE